MSAFQWLLLLFLVVPLVEIYLLIEVGGIIGVLPTIGLVVMTAVLGAFLMRAQGFATLAKVQENLQRGEIPAVPLFEGALILIAGALLLTPGFFTDAFGFLCLFPPLRVRVVQWFLSRHLSKQSAHEAAPQGGRIIEGEYRRDEDSSQR